MEDEENVMDMGNAGLSMLLFFLYKILKIQLWRKMDHWSYADCSSTIIPQIYSAQSLAFISQISASKTICGKGPFLKSSTEDIH